MAMNDAATYYMVEMDYPHETAAQREKFDSYYRRHIDMLLTIPGFLTAQRFFCAETKLAPFLALYRLSTPDVLTSEAYTSKAGRMSVHPDFRAFISDWDRNLVQGTAGGEGSDLSTSMEERMVLVDRLSSEAPPLPDGVAPLDVIGLDRTIAQRGAAVFAADEIGTAKPPRAREGWEIRVWEPIHAVRTPG